MQKPPRPGSRGRGGEVWVQARCSNGSLERREVRPRPRSHSPASWSVSLISQRRTQKLRVSRWTLIQLRRLKSLRYSRNLRRGFAMHVLQKKEQKFISNTFYLIRQSKPYREVDAQNLHSYTVDNFGASNRAERQGIHSLFSKSQFANSTILWQKQKPRTNVFPLHRLATEWS